MLARQPRNRMQAARWVHWLERYHFTVSIGLMQVNAEMAFQLHLQPEKLLDPCTNLRAGGAILISAYTELARGMGTGFAALDAALSIYNTGDPSDGVLNGYVAKVYEHAPRKLP